MIDFVESFYYFFAAANLRIVQPYQRYARLRARTALAPLDLPLAGPRWLREGFSRAESRSVFLPPSMSRMPSNGQA